MCHENLGKAILNAAEAGLLVSVWRHDNGEVAVRVESRRYPIFCAGDTVKPGMAAHEVHASAMVVLNRVAAHQEREAA